MDWGRRTDLDGFRASTPADDLPPDFAAQRATYYAALRQPEAADAYGPPCNTT